VRCRGACETRDTWEGLTTRAIGHQKSKAGAPKASLRLTSAAAGGTGGGSGGPEAAPAPPPLVLTFLAEAERDAFSDELAKILLRIKSKSKAGCEAVSAAEAARIAVAKATLLKTNEDVRALHTQLVGGGIVTEEDFWSSQAALVSAATAKRGLGQRAGIANTLMGAVRGEQDGRSKKVNFNLSKQQVAQIFAERPAVRKAYLKHVLPNGNLTDLQFWTKYCRVEYLKQARKGAPFTSEQDDADAALFAEDEADLKAAKADAMLAAAKLMPSVNVAATAADDVLRPGWGFAHAHHEADAVPSSGGGAGRTPTMSSRDVLLRDLNRHAAVVLQGIPDALPGDNAALARTVPRGRAAAQDSDDAPMLDDLRAPETAAVQPLRITDPRRYFDGSAGGTAYGLSDMPTAPASHTQPQAPRASWSALAAQIPGLVPPCPVVPSDLARTALSDVAHAVARPGQANGFEAMGAAGGAVPESVAKSLRDEARAANELLKFYWQLAPSSSESSSVAAKLERVRTALTALYDRLENTKSNLPGEIRHLASQQLRPLMASLDAALEHAQRGGGVAPMGLG
jgi:transcription initiation factor TFIIH subunit 1